MPQGHLLEIFRTLFVFINSCNIVLKAESSRFHVGLVYRKIGCINYSGQTRSIAALLICNMSARKLEGIDLQYHRKCRIVFKNYYFIFKEAKREVIH